MARLGFIGLGGMGSAIAGRLVGAGHEVLVWNRTAATADPLVGAGAIRVNSAEEALAAGTSFSMLADDRAAEAVLSAAALSFARGRIHVNMASVSAAAADRLAALSEEAGVAYVSAPVLGRPPVAAAGQLNILAAGPATAIDEVRAYLNIVGKRTWLLGDRPRMANVVKIAVNYNLIHTIEAIGESVALVERQGVDPGEFVELLTSSLFGGVAYTGYGAEIVAQSYDPPAFAMALGFKDLGLAEEVAADGGVTLPTGAALRRVFELALEHPELRSFDWGAIAEIVRRDLYREQTDQPHEGPR